MSAGILVVLAAGMCFILLLSLLTLVLILNNPGSVTGKGKVKGKVVVYPVAHMLTTGAEPWYLSGGSTANASIVGEALRVKNVARGYSTGSGINLAYKPRGMPARGAIMSYEVFFEPGWCWGGTSYGGKIPGFEFERPGGSGGTGGNWSSTAGSCRPMWGKDGSLNLYVYYNKSSNSDASRRSYAEQTPEFAAIASASGTAGQRLWDKGGFSKSMRVGTWHTIQVGMTLNTPGKQDGTALLSLDGEKKEYKKMFWRTTGDQLIDKIAMSVWHGGSGAEWGCPTDVYVRFRNFSIQLM